MESFWNWFYISVVMHNRNSLVHRITEMFYKTFNLVKASTVRVGSINYNKPQLWIPNDYLQINKNYLPIWKIYYNKHLSYR